jgi:hypothetical protein
LRRRCRRGSPPSLSWLPSQRSSEGILPTVVDVDANFGWGFDHVYGTIFSSFLSTAKWLRSQKSRAFRPLRLLYLSWQSLGSKSAVTLRNIFAIRICRPNRPSPDFGALARSGVAEGKGAATANITKAKRRCRSPDRRRQHTL